MKYLLSLDQGTTSSRAVLFDRSAQVVAAAQFEFDQIFPRSGWVEHDPNDIWVSQWRAIEQAFRRAGCGWEAVAAIGLTNQRETVVAWDADTGAALGNAIVWQDRRTVDLCDRLKSEGQESWIREKTGLLLDPYFSATKMSWLLGNNADVQAAAREGRLRFGTVDSWLAWKLTGGARHITDVSNASRTLLMDIRTGDWDERLRELFGIPRSSLPEIVDSSGLLAESSEVLTDRAIPISGIAGDQQAALFGQLCFEPGMVKCTYGTGCFILMHVGANSAVPGNRLLTTVAWRMSGKIEYALEGSVFMGGATVQWLRDQLGLIGRSSDIEALALSVPDSGGLVFVPAFTGMGAPRWDPHARGTIFGLSRGSKAGHLARASLEGIALQVVDVVRAMEGDSGRALTAMRADGGASVNALLMQLQADLTGVSVRCPKNQETTALGAAFLAGLGVGYWESKEALLRLVEAGAVYEPVMKAAARRRALDRWERAVESCVAFGTP